MSTGGGGGVENFKTGGVTDLEGVTFAGGSVPHYMPWSGQMGHFGTRILVSPQSSGSTPKIF